MADPLFSVTLSGTPPTVLALENNVLECFFQDGSTRVDVIHYKGSIITTAVVNIC